MSLLYNFIIKLYFVAISIASFLGKEKARLWLSGRKNWEKKLLDIPKGVEVVWFHAASLGEFEQARPLMEKVKREQPSSYILLSFFSPSGYEIQKNYAIADRVCYLPIDTPKNAKTFIDMVQPKRVVFVKYEFWFNYLKQLRKHKIKTVLVSGIFRESQHFFKFYGAWFRKGLNAFTHFYLQNETSQKLLNEIGFSNTSVVGDTRFDRVAGLAEEHFVDQRFESFSKGQKVIVFGSSWGVENELAIKLSKRREVVKLIIAPHEINALKIEQFKMQFQGGALMLSQTNVGQDLSACKVLIIDEIGLLSKLYRYATIAVIGGGFGAGIHNLLEAAVYACPVVFGPKYQKFQEAVDLLERGGAFSAESSSGLMHQINSLVDDSKKRVEASEQAKKYVDEKVGATDQIFERSFL